MYMTQLFSVICLSLAMHKHFKSCFKRVISVAENRVLTITGWLLLIISVQLLGQLSPLPLMIVYWVLLLGINITLVSAVHSLMSVKLRMKSR
jgi:hypothetical protein